MTEETKSSKFIDTTLLIFILCLAVAAIVFPSYIMAKHGLNTGAVAYFGTMFAWLTIMPSSCMNGGLIYSILAMPIFLSGIVVPLFAICKYVISVVT